MNRNRHVIGIVADNPGIEKYKLNFNQKVQIYIFSCTKMQICNQKIQTHFTTIFQGADATKGAVAKSSKTDD